MSAAFWISWRMPATCWRLGEGVWMLGRAGGGLEKKIGTGLIFWQEWLQVFVVMGFGCRELLEWGFGGLERWDSGGFLGVFG